MSWLATINWVTRKIGWVRVHGVDEDTGKVIKRYWDQEEKHPLLGTSGEFTADDKRIKDCY